MLYLLCVFIGFLLGVIITCILLAPKNLKTYQAISGQAEDAFKQNISAAKAAYKARTAELEGEQPEPTASDEAVEAEKQAIIQEIRDRFERKEPLTEEEYLYTIRDYQPDTDSDAVLEEYLKEYREYCEALSLTAEKGADA